MGRDAAQRERLQPTQRSTAPLAPETFEQSTTESEEMPGSECAPPMLGLSLLRPLIIFELANNHQGSPNHALEIIEGLAECKKSYQSFFDFAVKFQFRNIETFIDPEADPCANKHIARFRSTQITEPQFAELAESARARGFLVITTPFDEESVDQAIRLQITTLKIASCSALEWLLIKKASLAAQHLIVSTAGLNLDQIDALYSYLRHECRAGFTILHCIGIYPAPLGSLNLATIRRFCQRYPKARIGYSGHEGPADHHISATALALGAEVFERHVGITTPEFSLNTYSLTLADVAEWLRVMSDAMVILGRPKASNYANIDENSSLAALRRGVFAKADITSESEIGSDLVEFRFPLRDHQIDVAEFTSIYHRFVTTRRIHAGEPITLNNSQKLIDSRSQTLDRYVQRIRGIATEANIDIADGDLLEISHHFGVERLCDFGCCIINVLNRSYCKKLILMTEGQEHPEQHHKVKEETFKVLSGALQLQLDGDMSELKPGDTILIPAYAKHSFKALTDVIVEELSTTSSPEDSFYTDVRIASRPRTARKSMVRNFIRSD
jgi:sialic acid synthase SpsE/mannose-6-phosphate isomerase-like protein (cupin superfamily)